MADLSRLTPEVRTLAKPQAVPLIGARGVVHRSPTLKAVFVQAKQEGWAPERLAGAITPELEQALNCEPEAAVEVAQYLADEFFQLGDAVLVCDRATGRAIARIAETDIYQPPQLRRENGVMAEPIPRLNPNLEGFLVSYIFEQERDRTVRAEIAARLPRTAFLTPEIDPRLSSITRAGRTGVAQAVREGLPDVLDHVQGSARAFLNHFTRVEAPPDGLDALPVARAEAIGRQNVVDPKAMNLWFSWEATLKARSGTGWVRDIAGYMAARAETRAEVIRTTAELLDAKAHLEGYNFWLGEPGMLRAIQKSIHPRQVTILPVPNVAAVVGFTRAPVGALIVDPAGYTFNTREIHGRWEMIARMDYTLCVDWGQVRYLVIGDIPAEAIAEIL